MAGSGRPPGPLLGWLSVLDLAARAGGCVAQSADCSARVLATMLYDLVGAFAFPLDKTSQPVSPTVVTRLFAQFAVAVFVAIGAAMVAAEPSRRAPPPP